MVDGDEGTIRSSTAKRERCQNPRGCEDSSLSRDLKLDEAVVKVEGG